METLNTSLTTKRNYSPAICLAIALLSFIAASVLAPVAAMAQQDDLAEVARLEKRAFAHLNAGRYDEALPLAQRALTICEKVFGPDDPEVATSLNNLAVLYEAKGDYTRAEKTYRRALVILENALGPNHPNVANVLDNLVLLYTSMGDRTQAQKLMVRVLAIRSATAFATVTNRASEEADRLLEQAFALHRDGRYDEAIPLAQRALHIHERTLGPDHPDVAIALNSLGILYRAKGEYDRAEPLYQRAYAITVKARGPDHQDVALSLNNLALLYHVQGDYTRAEKHYRQALVILEKAHKPDALFMATLLHNFADLHRIKGDYTRAEQLNRRALEIRENALGPDAPEVAESLNNLALLSFFRGDYSHAEPLFQQVNGIYKRALGPDHPYVATSLNNLAVICLAKGDYTRSESLHREALAIREKVLEPDDPDVAESRANLAFLYVAKGDYARAEPLYARALAVREKVQGPDHLDVAMTLNNFAGLYIGLGDYSRAKALLLRALAIQEKALGPDHLDVALALFNIAVLHWAEGHSTQALPLLERAASATERHFSLHLALGSEREKLAFLNTRKGEVNIHLSFHLQAMPDSPEAAGLALATSLRRKGRAMDAMAGVLSNLRRHAGPEERKLLDRLEGVRTELSALIFGAAGGAMPAQVRRERLVALELKHEKLERELSRRSAHFRVEQAPTTLENVAGILGEGRALLEYVRYQPFDPKAKGNEEQFGPSRYAAAVLRTDGEIEWKDLGLVEAIDKAVDGFRRNLIGRKADVAERSREVYDLVMRPLEEFLGGAEHLYIAPDGELNLVPFWALADEDGCYLIEKYGITYLTSGRDLLRQKERGEPKSGPVAFADPEYAAGGGGGKAEKQGRRSADLGNLTFKPLPGTKKEVAVAKDVFRNIEVRTGAEATEERVKALLSPSVLIAATHGFFLPDQEVKLAPGSGWRGGGFSGVGAGIGGTMSAVPAVVGKVENPMLRSGLAFAGANTRKSGSEDGILTALEASGLDLWGTRLVVLSACETAVGEAKTGQGVYGLKRSLVLAGSETQVLSLWSVDDEATAALMGDYYRRVADGEGRSEAMRRAALGIRSKEKWSHPYYWAAFVVNGDPRALSKGDFAVLGVPTVSPGPRGCSCGMVGVQGGSLGWPLRAIIVLAVCLVFSRRRRNRTLKAR